MRTTVLTVILLAAASAVAVPPCKPKLEHLKPDQARIENLQVQKVNSGKEDWRRDPKQTVQHEIYGGLAQSQAKTPDMIPVTFVKGDDKTQVFSYTAPDRRVEITLKKPEWLLPYSGIYKLMMWVATDVKTVCTK